MPLGGVLFLVVFIGIFGCILLLLARLIGGKAKYSPVKYDLYECGLPGQEKRETKISVKFYLTAILFILFDIEIIFMYPWAASFREFMASGIGGAVFTAMTIFVIVFVYGLFWEIKSKALEWD